MKNNNLAIYFIVLIFIMHNSSCTFLDEDKCLNEVVLNKSWAGENRYGTESGINVLWFSINLNEDYTIRITDVCPFGALAIKATITEKNGLPKPGGGNSVPFDYAFYVYHVVKTKNGSFRQLVAYKHVYRSKVSGIVTLNKELSLDGFLEDGPREYQICFNTSYIDFPESYNLENQTKEDITRVDFQVNYIRY